MVDDNILKPGSPHCHNKRDGFKELTHLFKENYLSEFQTDEEKAIVRRNLDLIAKSDLPLEVVDIVNYKIYKGEIDLSKVEINTDKLRAELDAEIAEKLDNLEVTKVINEEAVWVPSGPIMTSIGFIEDNTEYTTPMTLQQLADALFYNKSSLRTNVFVGLISDINTEINEETLNTLLAEDSKNNSYCYFNVTLQHDYDFADPSLKYLILAVPTDYPVLKSLNVGAQEFRIDAFKQTLFEMTTTTTEETTETEEAEETEESTESGEDKVTYNVYIYKQGLATLSTSVLFNF